MLTIQVFDGPAQNYMLADVTHKMPPENGGGGGLFTTDRHGFGSLELPLLPMTLTEAFNVYTWPGTPHVVVSDAAARVIWEGRLEDISIVERGVALTAFGYQRAYRDVPYTGLWSDTSSAAWEPIDNTMSATYDTQQYETDNNNRLYIALRQGESYANGADLGAFTYVIPDASARNITNFDCSYSMLLPSGWIFRITATTEAFGSSATLNTVTATGSGQSGTLSLTLGTSKARINAWIRNDTGSTSTPAVPTGDYYLRLTGLRIKTTTAASVLASAIATSVANAVDAVNGTQVGNTTMLVTATTTDLRDELYEDEYPADIFDRLATLHDYEWGVYENRNLHFRPRGTGGTRWYVDATAIVRLQRSLEEVRNSAYSVYRDASGNIQRTDTDSDTASETRYGITRRGTVNVQTTSETEAETHRDVYLSDRADRSARAEIHFERAYTVTGDELPLYFIRAGDTITIRNLSPGLSTDIDRIRTFVVGETSYDMETGSISISPDDPTPELTRLVARRDAGVR